MRDSSRHTLDPKLDVVFKILFSQSESKPCLIALLTSVLKPEAPIIDVDVLNPEMPRRDVTDKGVVLDLRVRMADGALVDVEMQSQRRAGSRKRFLYYWSKTYVSQLSRGEDYVTLAPVIVVVFADYRELKSRRLHSTFRVLEVTDQERLCDDLEIHLIELPNLPELTSDERVSGGSLTGWARFLSAETDEEIEAIAKEDKMVEQAKDVLERLSDDPKVRELAEWREAHMLLDKMQRQMESKEAREKGLAEGRAEGRAEGEFQLLLKMLERRFGPLSTEQVARVEAGDIEKLSERLLNVESFDELFG